jgi:preprotein translocase subunit YajC
MTIANLILAGQVILAQAVEKAVPAPAGAGAGSGAAAPAGDAAGGGAQGPTSILGSPLLMVGMFIAVMYFFLLRPQQKQEKERRSLLDSLAKGDQVVTTGGVCGTIVGLSDTSVVLRVDDNVKMEFIRGAITQITASAADAKKK